MKIRMVLINKSEKDAICSKFSNVHIVRTMKQKSKRHHYYCEESKPVMKLLEEMRGLNATDSKKVGGNEQYRKKSR